MEQIQTCKKSVGVLHPALESSDRKDMDTLDKIQRRATKTITKLEYVSYEDRLRELVLVRLERRKFWGDLTAAFQYLKGPYKKDEDKLFNRVCSYKIRHNDFKLKENRLSPDTRKRFLTLKAAKHWNRLLTVGVDDPSLETLEVRMKD